MTSNFYCPDCDGYTDTSRCECGAEAERRWPDDERERDDDDGLTYGDPRDEREERRWV